MIDRDQFNKSANYIKHISKNKNKVYEIDIILKYPYLVIHDSDYMIKVKDKFNLCTKTSNHKSLNLKSLNQNDKQLLNKSIIDLTESEIRCLKYKSLDTPIILTDALKQAKEFDLKLYLDIKVPILTSNKNRPDGNELKICISQLLDIIIKEKALDRIDTIISFDDMVSTFLREEIDLKCINLDIGMFIYNDVKNTTKYYELFIKKIRPSILSYDYDLLKDDPSFLSAFDKVCKIKMKYVWTIHVDDVDKEKSKYNGLYDKFESNNIALVVDTFHRI
jgi:hypothetical protein